ncbi:polysaccharide pyruvyl transferase family protein [Aquimarina rhabdastrellae]
MKKIYTITFHHVLNYGAVLQAYALAKFLKNNDKNVSIIDYRPSYFLYKTYRPKKKIFTTYTKVLKAIRFYKFRRDFLPLTDDIFFSTKSLKKAFSKSDDFFICGSDQVWNANLTNGKLDEGFFQDFLPESANKISYAASMGETPFNNKEFARIASNLKSYKKILVREDFVQNEIKRVDDNILSNIVVDPSLLIDDYSEIIDYSLVPSEPYIVSYLTEDSKSVREYINKVVEMTGLPLINLGGHKIKEAKINYLYESPSKWLGVFAKASLVCTNSFHGNAYSLIFKRNFTVFTRETKKRLNRRQLTLLERVGLESRFINKLEDLNHKHLEEIDYSIINEKYQDLVNQSKRLLLDALAD